jgi:DNA-binding NtrC family response regulator
VIAAQPAFGVLVANDDFRWLRRMSDALQRRGLTNVIACRDPRELLRALDGRDVGVLVLDLELAAPPGPGCRGEGTGTGAGDHSSEELLAQITSAHPDVAVVVVCGRAQVQAAVRCMHLGAFDYFVEGEGEDRVAAGVVRAVRMQELRRLHDELTSRLAGAPRGQEAFSRIVTCDPAMRALFSYVEAVAKSPQPLLVAGESGVGKELVARAAHALSGCPGPLVAMNVAGLDDAVFADALFGHVRGAFTGADEARRGLAEEAAGGTLFLDEIGDLSPPSQVKLLRFLQDGEYFPMGSDQPRRVKTRVIAATHQDLAAKERSGAFRRDLYYRIRTHHVRVPPLRERKGDLPLLVEHFLDEAARSLGKARPRAPRQLAQLLEGHDFPGNVRELRAMVYDAVSLERGDVLSLETFRNAIRGTRPPRATSPAARRNPFAALQALPSFEGTLALLVDEAMARAGGNQTAASRLLGISQPALWKRLRARRHPPLRRSAAAAHRAKGHDGGYGSDTS